MDYRLVSERIRRGKIHSFYLFNGPEEYLKEELLRELRKKLEKNGKHFSLERIDLNASEKGLPELIQGLRQTTIQTSLLSGGRIFWVTNSLLFSSPRKETATRKENSAAEEKEILGLLEQDSSDEIIIISVPRVDKRKKIVSMIEKAGKLVDFPLLKGAALLKWLTDRLAREKIQAEEEALLELVERAGENLTLLNSELEKIILYLGGEKTVSRELVRRLVPGSIQGNIFQLTEAVGLKKMNEAVLHLNRITAQNEPPLVILAMITRQFRLLFQLSLLQDKNFSRREIIAALKIQPFFLDKLQEQVKNYTSDSLAQIFRYLKETDSAIKSGRLEAKDALEQMVLRLTAC